MQPRPKPRPVANPRCGLVGAARARNGLGPYLARDLEAAGARVVAAAGRDPGRTAAAAAELGERLGHAVAAYGSVQAMLAEAALDALVVAAPIPAHLPALRAALGAGLSVLCEKPLVAPHEHHLVPGLVEAFAARGLLLMENCQLPFVLPVLDALYPTWRASAVEAVEMGMSPASGGRAMVEDSASHFLSVLQALLPVDQTTRVSAARALGAACDAAAARVQLELESPFPRVQATLYLEVRAEQPRPQWIAVNGMRIDRRIRSRDYAISYCSAARCVAVRDPLAALVEAFVHSLREPDLDRIREHAAAVRERARLYSALVDAWDRAATPGR